MAHFSGSSSQPPLHRRHPDPPWLWLALMGGSIVVHCLLIASSLPLLDRIATPPLEDASIPIDFVELPPQSGSIETAPSASAAPHSTSPFASTPAPAPIDPANFPPPAPIPDAIGFAGDVSVAPVPDPIPPDPIPPDPTAPIVSPEAVPPSPDPATTPFTAPSTDLPSLTPVNPNLPPAAPAAPDPTASATPPGFATSQINVPIPDVSETLTLPNATVDPNSLAQTGVNQTAAPLHLMANLAIDRFVDAADNPETIATPVDDMTSQEISDPKTSACLSALQPAILPALGTAIVLQVETDATGQVTQTTVQQSSQNAAYDELAQCAVKHWRFNPAMDQGVPVASNALQVRITIDPKNAP